MSSFTDLFNRVQMLAEAKVSPIGKQADVFKNVPKQMKAAGMAASSRDAMIFITQVLSRLDIITPEVYEMTIKGQHRERMEKLMTILRSKEEEINAKSDEIVEYINQNLDNYTAGAGTDRNRAEKYKETAKAMSQEVQNIKAGKEADDALRDIVKTADQDTIESLEFSAEDTSTIIEINAGNVANVDRVRDAVEQFANDLGVEVTGNTVEFSVDEGSQIDQMVKKNGVTETEAFLVNYFKGDYPITVSIIPPAGAEEKERVQATADAFKAKPEGKVGREHVASVGNAADKFLKSRGIEDAETEDSFPADMPSDEFFELLDDVSMEVGSESYEAIVDALESKLGRELTKREAGEAKQMAQEDELPEIEDAEGKHDDNDGEEERCDYVPCEDGEVEKIEIGGVTYEVGSLDPSNGERIISIEKHSNGYMITTGSGAEAGGYALSLDGQHMDEDDLEDGLGHSEIEDAEDGAIETIEIGGVLYEVGGPDPSNESELIISIEKHSNGYMITTGQFSSPEDFVTQGPDSAIEAGGYALSLDGKLMKSADLEDGLGHSEELTLESVYDAMGFIKASVMNENGTVSSTCSTQQYLMEATEQLIEESEKYTTDYLTEQKAADSYRSAPKEKSVSFKERFKPKTQSQLEELRRYGL